eukprot:jgi/Chlat1/7286/Chrsp58S06912
MALSGTLSVGVRLGSLIALPASPSSAHWITAARHADSRRQWPGRGVQARPVWCLRRELSSLHVSRQRQRQARVPVCAVTETDSQKPAVEEKAPADSSLAAEVQQSSPSSSSSSTDREFLEWIGWDVPWSGRFVTSVMVAWGLGRQWQGALHFVSSRTAFGLAFINRSVSKFQPLSKDFFNFDWQNPWSGRDGWAWWGGVGYLMTFPVVALVSAATFATGLDQRTQGGTIDAFMPLIGSNIGSTLSLLTVSSVFAPILEETVFRGFLLTSLTKWMPVYGAVLISSALFAMAHSAPNDFFQLTALGCVLGFSYARTRRLQTPMIIHALWNSGVLLFILVLKSAGVDVKQFM